MGSLLDIAQKLEATVNSLRTKIKTLKEDNSCAMTQVRGFEDLLKIRDKEIVELKKQAVDLKRGWHYPCDGCEDGHPSFWKTITESPQWKDWEKGAWEAGYDYDECEQGGMIGKEHLQSFLKFTIDNFLSKQEKRN